MRDLARAFAFAFALGTVVIAAACASQPARSGARAGIGTPASRASIDALDIDVAPDGANLPSGRATAADGVARYRTSCAGCHGPRLPLDRWTHATSLFDYIRRAMPPQSPRRMSAADLYGVTAYLLYTDGRLGEHDIVDAAALVRLHMDARSENAAR